MAFRVNCGSPHVALRSIVPSIIRGKTRNCYVRLQSRCSWRSKHDELLLPGKFRPSLRQDRTSAVFGQLFECRRLHFFRYVVPSLSLLIARSFSSAQISPVGDFTETDYEEQRRFEEKLPIGASSSKETQQTASFREVKDLPHSLRNTKRALETENELLEQLYDTVSSEREDLKREKENMSMLESTPTSFSSTLVSSNHHRSITGASGGDMTKQPSSLIAKESLRTNVMSPLEANAVAGSRKIVDRSDVSDPTPRSLQKAPETQAGEVREIMGVISSKGGGNASDSNPLESAESQSWPEWTAFLQHLKKLGYFSSDSEDNFLEEDGGSQEYSRLKKAVMKFGRDRDDIFESFSKNDLKVLASFGCPTIERKVVNAGKRLRSHCGILESTVCESCSLKNTCARAFSESKAGAADTLDVIRLLLQFSLQAAECTGEHTLPLEVEASILNLLRQAIKLTRTPRNPNLPPPEIRKSSPRPVRNKPKAKDDPVEMEPEDWRCSRCRYINFRKNERCRQCLLARPSQELRPGEWECPKCLYVNYSKNMACRECRAERPRQSSVRKIRSIENSRQNARVFNESKGSYTSHSFDQRNYRNDSSSFGELTRSRNGLRPKHGEWKLGLFEARKKLDNRVYNNANGSGTDSENGNIQLFDDLDSSDEEAARTKSWKSKNHKKLSRDEDEDDVWMRLRGSG